MSEHVPQAAADPDPATHAAPLPAAPPRRRRRTLLAVGLSLLVLLAGGGAVVYPDWVASRLNANESMAIATLKNVSSGQSQCQAAGIIDVNGNGSGEYGFFGELSGHARVRGSALRIEPEVLSKAFGEVARSQVERGGYVFQMFLPDREQQGIAEDAAGGDVANDNGVDPRWAETLWCCYAWPRIQGRSGKRTFFVNQGGDVLATNGAVVAYDGASRPCMFDVAFAASSGRSMAAAVAANTVAHDGNTWVVV